MNILIYISIHLYMCDIAIKLYYATSDNWYSALAYN